MKIMDKKHQRELMINAYRSVVGEVWIMYIKPTNRCKSKPVTQITPEKRAKN